MAKLWRGSRKKQPSGSLGRHGFAPERLQDSRAEQVLPAIGDHDSARDVRGQRGREKDGKLANLINRPEASEPNQRGEFFVGLCVARPTHALGVRNRSRGDGVVADATVPTPAPGSWRGQPSRLQHELGKG